ncbi:HpcH/HpaI aldolase/citrate lyase family protein [Sporosarcina ureae]|uniref:HpcH/HpaI aldolase family protein n=1 Tax=Sporosarcina ureae TaxID=1571 RepID=UPI0026EE4C95|nr:aldolase/citrate lyase family protein [Sporosarcina ureae]
MKNVLKQKLKNQEKVLGAFLSINSPSLIEMIAYSGFDYVIIDDEHGAFSASELEGLIRTADGVGITPIVRVSYDPSSIQKALDRGAHGIQVPMVNTKEEAEAVVRQAKFPPLGERGVSYSIRPARYGIDKGSKYLEECNENILVIVHIETEEAAKNFKDIISTKGVDMAFIGSTDLSVNMGYYDDGANALEVKSVIDNLYSIAQESDIWMGTVAANGAQAKDAFLKGSLYVCTVLNGIMANAMRQTVLDSEV